MRRALARLSPALVLGLVVGCGSSEGPKTPEEARSPEAVLREVGEIYRLSTVQGNNKPPASFKALRNGGEYPIGMGEIRSGLVVVAYGTPMPETGEDKGVGPEGGVIAYGKDVPTKGGPVLMANRTVKTVTADEFKAIAPVIAPPAATKK